MPSGLSGALLPEAVRRRFRDRPLLRRLLGSGAWRVGDKVFRLGSGVFISAYIARYLGPYGLGLLSFGSALAFMVSAIGQFALNDVIVRDLINRPQDRPVILASAWLMRLFAAAVATVLSVGLSLLLRPGDELSAVVVLCFTCAAFPQAWNVIDYDYQSRIEARPVVLARNISFIAFAVIRIGLVLAGASVECFALAFTGEVALSAALLARRWHKDGLKVPASSARWREVRHLASMSTPLVIAGLSLAIYMRIDQVMLAKMLGNVEVGLFSAAVRISEALYFLPVAVATSVAPALTAARKQSVAEYERRFLKVARMLVGAAFVVAVCFTLLAKPIILILYGPSFARSAAVLSIHTWAGVVVSLGVCGNLWLVNEGYLKFTMYQTMVGAAVNVALNLVMIPRLGIVGAALASCAGQLVSVVVTVAVLPKTRRLFRLQLASLLPVPV